jgi:DnaJ-class molecular chaperone
MAGTKVRFEGMGEGGGDTVFVVEEAPHPRFKREGDNLVFTARVPLVEAHGHQICAVLFIGILVANAVHHTPKAFTPHLLRPGRFIRHHKP